MKLNKHDEFEGIEKFINDPNAIKKWIKKSLESLLINQNDVSEKIRKRDKGEKFVYEDAYIDCNGLVVKTLTTLGPDPSPYDGGVEIEIPKDPEFLNSTKDSLKRRIEKCECGEEGLRVNIPISIEDDSHTIGLKRQRKQYLDYTIEKVLCYKCRDKLLKERGDETQ